MAELSAEDWTHKEFQRRLSVLRRHWPGIADAADHPLCEWLVAKTQPAPSTIRGILITNTLFLAVITGIVFLVISALFSVERAVNLAGVMVGVAVLGPYAPLKLRWTVLILLYAALLLFPPRSPLLQSEPYLFAWLFFLVTAVALFPRVSSGSRFLEQTAMERGNLIDVWLTPMTFKEIAAAEALMALAPVSCKPVPWLLGAVWLSGAAALTGGAAAHSSFASAAMLADRAVFALGMLAPLMAAGWFALSDATSVRHQCRYLLRGLAGHGLRRVAQGFGVVVSIPLVVLSLAAILALLAGGAYLLFAPEGRFPLFPGGLALCAVAWLWVRWINRRYIPGTARVFERLVNEGAPLYVNLAHKLAERSG